MPLVITDGCIDKNGKALYEEILRLMSTESSSDLAPTKNEDKKMFNKVCWYFKKAWPIVKGIFID